LCTFLTIAAFVFPPVEHQGHGSQGIAVQGKKIIILIKIVLDKVDGEIDMNNMSSKWCCVETEIFEVIDEFTYKIKDDVDIKETEIFIYGTLKQDFKTIDYKSLHAINIKATQELYKIIQKLEERIKILEQK
jgi:hypothetical protein